jgi:hypothetical protein
MSRRLRGKWNRPCSAKGLREPCQHREVGVKRDALQATDAERRQAVLVL